VADVLTESKLTLRSGVLMGAIAPTTQLRATWIARRDALARFSANEPPRGP